MKTELLQQLSQCESVSALHSTCSGQGWSSQRFKNTSGIIVRPRVKRPRIDLKEDERTELLRVLRLCVVGFRDLRDISAIEPVAEGVSSVVVNGVPRKPDKPSRVTCSSWFMTNDLLGRRRIGDLLRIMFVRVKGTRPLLVVHVALYTPILDPVTGFLVVDLHGRQEVFMMPQLIGDLCVAAAHPASGLPPETIGHLRMILPVAQ